MPTYLFEERLNAGGYTSQGQYFGNVPGTAIYWFDLADGSDSGFIRARDHWDGQQQLRRRYPQLNLRFFRTAKKTNP